MGKVRTGRGRHAWRERWEWGGGGSNGEEGGGKLSGNQSTVLKDGRSAASCPGNKYLTAV